MGGWHSGGLADRQGGHDCCRGWREREEGRADHHEPQRGRLRAGRQGGHLAGHEPGVCVLRPLHFYLLGSVGVRVEKETVREGAACGGLLSSTLSERACVAPPFLLPCGSLLPSSS